MRFQLVAVACFCLLFCLSANALGLIRAKDLGLVGEMYNGYLGVVVNRADALELVNKVNKQRREKYEDLARRNGLSLKEVEEIAGKVAIKRASRGHHYQTEADDKWRRKK